MPFHGETMRPAQWCSASYRYGDVSRLTSKRPKGRTKGVRDGTLQPHPRSTLRPGPAARLGLRIPVASSLVVESQGSSTQHGRETYLAIPASPTICWDAPPSSPSSSCLLSSPPSSAPALFSVWPHAPPLPSITGCSSTWPSSFPPRPSAWCSPPSTRRPPTPHRASSPSA